MYHSEILFITTMSSYPWGGSEELWSQTAAELAHRGRNVSTLQPEIARGHPKSCSLQKIVGTSNFINRKRSFFRRRILRKFDKASWQFKEVKKARPEFAVVSQGNNREGLNWMRAFRDCLVPYMAIIQCNADWWYPTDSEREALKELYKAADCIVCVSRQNLELLRLQLAEPLPNAVVIPNPFCLDDHPAPEFPDLHSSTLRLACVARIEPHAKGLDVLLRLFAEEKWRSRPIQLNLYGDGPYRQGLEGTAHYLGLTNVKFLGKVASYKEIWDNEHALVLPSRYEGISLALLECMWCARPALTTRVGGAEEIIVDGVNGFLADACTVQALDRALERMWEARFDLAEMGRQARKRITSTITESPAVLLADKIESTMKAHAASS